jgi:hypothetical protein
LQNYQADGYKPQKLVVAAHDDWLIRLLLAMPTLSMSSFGMVASMDFPDFT